MVEVVDEVGYVWYYFKKIVLIFIVMCKFVDWLWNDGWQVVYMWLDDVDNVWLIIGELICCVVEFGVDEVIVIICGLWWLISVFEDLLLLVYQFGDDCFIVSLIEFVDWVEGCKLLCMEYFYCEVWCKIGLLMDGDKFEGGKWNYDSENCKFVFDEVIFGGLKWFVLDIDVVVLVKDRFGYYFGEIELFWFVMDYVQVEEQLDYWLKGGLL